MSIERQALAGLTWTGAGKILGQLVSWTVTLVVVRLLAPDDYGLMAITAVFLSLLTSVAELGMGAALVQAPTLERDDASKVAGLAMLTNLGIGVALAASAPLIAAFVNDPRLTLVIQVGALQFIPAALATAPQAMLYRAMDFKRLAAFELVSALVASGVTLMLAIGGRGVWSLVLGMLAGACVRALLFEWAAGVRPSFKLAGTGRFLRFGGAMTFSRLVWQFTSQCDVLVGGRFLSKEALGIYSVSLHVATLPMQRIMSIINQVAFPTVARLQDDRPRLRERLLYATRILMFVGLPLTWGIAAIAPEIVALVFGPKWEAAVFPLQVLAIVIPLKMFSSILATAIAAIGETRLDVRNNVTAAIVLPISFLIGVQWGVNGLALSWVAAGVIVLIITLPAILRVIGITAADFLRATIAPAIAGVSMLIAVHVVRMLIAPQPATVATPLLIATGAIAYLGVSLVLQKDLWNDLRRLKSTLRG